MCDKVKLEYLLEVQKSFVGPMNRQPSIPTLEDVARAAGVSTATVSRCLNEKEKVSKSTLSKVMEAVEKLGYTPNFNARAMAARRSNTIGAIIPTMENAIFARGIQAFQVALHEKGYNLLVSSNVYRPELETELIKSLVSRGADGLLLIGHSRDSETYQYLERRGIPTVLAWSMQPGQTHTCVGFDNRASMHPLADKVIELGHRRIGVISGIVEGNDRAQSRLEAIKDSMTAHGLTLDPEMIIETFYELDNGSIAFEQLMQKAAPPTAVMCGNDVLAAGAIAKAREMGIKVPEDVSITGFDDIELAKHVYPALTTVHVPHREMGRRAADVLIDLIEDRGSASTIQLDTEVVMRDSLGPPKA